MKHLFKWAASAFVAVSLAACGGGGGSAGATAGSGGQSTPLTTTAPSPVTIQVGEAESYSVSGGTGPYTVVTDNSSIAVGSLSGNTLTIGAVSSGNATISVIDAKNAKVAVSVVAQVRPMATNAPSAITLANGETSVAFTIRNGKSPYSVISTNLNVATVTQPTANTFTITGVNTGSASVIVSDGVGTTFTVSVSVAPALSLFTTAPSALSLTVGNAPTYSIFGGSPPYTVMSSNTSVATVSQPTSTTFKITAVSNGAANVVVQDSSGHQVTISVAVVAQQITINPSTVNTIIGVTNYAYITGGVPPYHAVSTFAGVATVDVGTLDSTGTVFTSNPNGNVLKTIANQVASNNVVIVSDSAGAQGQFSMTSATGSTTFTFAPETLTISACTTSPLTLTLLGGSGTYTVFSSDTSQFSAAVSGSTVTITPVAAPIVSGEYIFTAIDKNGSTAQASVSVVAPQGTCP